ncbi:MAG: monovalent cation/H+ antiporter subunit D family protein [Pseudomonadales bacterium]
MIDNAQLPALVVVAPLLAATVCALVREARLCWWIATIALAVSCIDIVTMGLSVFDGRMLSYAMGGWEPPIGIEYRVDALAVYMLGVVGFMSLIVHVYGVASVRAEIPAHLRGWYHAVYLLCTGGLLGMVITGDTFNAFVFMEIASLSAYTLIAMGKDRRALTAAFQYLILGTIGATFYVIGVGFLYLHTGTLNMADLDARLDGIMHRPGVLTGLGFLIAGLALKSALFPLHLWLPNAYAWAPSTSSALLAATATKVTLYLLIRFAYDIFDFDVSVAQANWSLVLFVLSLTAITVGSLLAIAQDNVKRMLAYSSVAQIGYITFGIAVANLNSLTGALVHLANHALMKGALFMLMGGIMLRLGSVHLPHLAGIGRQMPWTMAGFVLAGASLLGVPGTVGFVSKWYLAVGALEAGHWSLVLVLMASSLIALAYMGRVIEMVYLRERPADAPTVTEAPRLMVAATWLVLVACIYFGLDTDLTAGLARAAAESIMDQRR